MSHRARLDAKKSSMNQQIVQELQCNSTDRSLQGSRYRCLAPYTAQPCSPPCIWLSRSKFRAEPAHNPERQNIGLIDISSTTQQLTFFAEQTVPVTRIADIAGHTLFPTRCKNMIANDFSQKRRISGILHYKSRRAKQTVHP